MRISEKRDRAADDGDITGVAGQGRGALWLPATSGNTRESDRTAGGDRYVGAVATVTSGLIRPAKRNNETVAVCADVDIPAAAIVTGPAFSFPDTVAASWPLVEMPPGMLRFPV